MTTMPSALQAKRDELAMFHAKRITRSNRRAYLSYISGFDKCHEILAAENAKLRDALKYYADVGNYLCSCCKSEEDCRYLLLDDMGRRAAAALSGKEKRNENQ